MKKSSTLLLSGLSGLALFFILPSWSKIFSLLVPALAISFSFSEKGLNIPLLVLILFFALFFPSNLFQLDANATITRFTTSPIAKIINEGSNLLLFLLMFFSIIIPIALIAGGVYAIVFTNVEQGINAVVKAVIIIIILILFIYIADLMNWSLFGLEDYGSVIQTVWDAIKRMYSTISDWLSAIGVKAPELDQSMTDLQTSFDQSITLNAFSPRVLRLAFGSMYAPILSFISIIIGFWSKLFGIEPYWKSDSDKIRFSNPHSFQLQFVIFLLIEIIVAFMLYLSYSIDAFLNYRSLGYFTLYLTVIVSLSILLSMGIGVVSKNNLLGVGYGVILLWVFQNLFSVINIQTLSALGSEYHVSIPQHILTTFLFVAPTESLIFHVFIPSLALFYFVQRNNRMSQISIQEQIAIQRDKIETLKTSAEIHKETHNAKAYAKTMSIVDKERRKLRTLENQKEFGMKDTLSDTQKLIFILISIGSNLLFSTLHYFKSGLDFLHFWISGLGFLYLSSGLILTLIAYRYGWISAVLSHAIHNSLILMLLMVMS